MPDNQDNQSNAVSIDTIKGDLKNMTIESKEECNDVENEKLGEFNKYPDRPGEPDCLYYLRTGLCGYGTNCRFNHPPLANKTAQSVDELPQREGQPDCGFYLKTGGCRYGSTCKYHHPLDRRDAAQVPLNSYLLPIRPEEKPCTYYMQTYRCKFGRACKYNHPEPAADQTTLSLHNPSNAGAMQSTLASSVIPYGATFPSWSVTRSSYMASSRVNYPPMYMPVVYPPFIAAAQDWHSNGYMGHVNSVSASGLMGTSLPCHSKNQEDLMVTVNSDFPERPDQPECRYFMSNGRCKFGANCKYHHPKERIPQLGMGNTGPHGLPLRPGENFPGYYFGMPMPIVDHQRNSGIPNSSATSHSKASKITDWIQKPETVEEKNTQNSQQVEENSVPATSEVTTSKVATEVD